MSYKEDKARARRRGLWAPTPLPELTSHIENSVETAQVRHPPAVPRPPHLGRSRAPVASKREKFHATSLRGLRGQSRQQQSTQQCTPKAIHEQIWQKRPKSEALVLPYTLTFQAFLFGFLAHTMSCSPRFAAKRGLPVVSAGLALTSGLVSSE